MWNKLGLVFDAAKYTNQQWFCNSALTPQPFRLNDETIRVFAGFRDAEGVSRIGYVDIASGDPSRILGVSKTPVLDIGRDGCFDDNGVIMGDVVKTPSGVYLFYVGFQLVRKAKFLAFSGVALSEDGGETFRRLSESPILERDRFQSTIGAIHTARYENGVWRIWFARGDGWEMINGVPYPQYHICYTETKDLLNIPRSAVTCVEAVSPEYRIGRPKVYKVADGSYVMYATKGTISGEYTPSFFRSNDGIKWERDDSSLGIAPSESGWDSETLCYPTLISDAGQTLMIYNGNKMGLNGFGAAVGNQVVLA
ncbi:MULTISPECIES: hypothetical protein [Pandoraea]|uniref:Glycosyl hydrolase family 32 N-terminal domain-containing protein n=1 Tax=Pandoraea capi TaxID=2508286 RepID=A0ABY6W8I8_9BURK|nr:MULTISPECIES: hypothetical protein [Pandoraea]MCI3204945.1 hypothetical protein [Pandoraea sp. LA3]MDN4582973.1 hypothetical protein [Pandoraea capi]VVE39680.1 hypothetical protein PCA20602_04097 [Pandoraea capi]